MMAKARDAARTYGKSDPIDALAVARAALREPDLPAARLDDDSRQVRLLVDHREDLIAERTRQINRLRWHLHELNPAWDPPQRSLNRYKQLDEVITRLADYEGLVARLALELATSIRELTVRINDLEREITVLVKALAPTLLTRPGIGVLTAAKLLGETANITRFRNKDAYARHNGTAPLPVWSGNRTRHRLARTGNRQLNCAIHRIAITQGRCHPEAIAYFERRIARGNTPSEARRALKRRLSDLVYRDLLHDASIAASRPSTLAA
jgi:transposase